jgi:CheY-like chemotaxis protein
MLGEDITLTFRPVGFPVYINADLGQIEQLVMNLVLNARDAMPNGGEIFVETGIMDVKLAYVDKHAAIPPGRYVTLSVTDTGCGMDDKTLTQMFEPFFTTKPSGTGLGLATVREIVRRSNGRVWVHSKPGEGTTFRLYFPQVDQPANFSLQQQHEFFPSGGRETVLVVEDDEILRLMMATLLRDGVMSQMSGIALAKRLRALRSDLKVVVVSGYGPGLMAKYGPLGSRTDFVEKPFTRNTLLGSVRALLDDKPTMGVETPSGGR